MDNTQGSDATIYEITWVRRSDNAWLTHKTYGLSFQGACKYGLDRCNTDLHLKSVECLQRGA